MDMSDLFPVPICFIEPFGVRFPCINAFFIVLSKLLGVEEFIVEFLFAFSILEALGV